MLQQNRVQKCILKVSGGIIYGLFALIVVFLFYLSLFTTCFMVYTDEHVYYVKDYAIVMGVGLVALLLILTLLRERGISLRTLQVMAVIATIVVSAFLIMMISTLHLQAIYDQGTVYHGAKSFLAGDYTQWEPGGYFHMLAYQNGMMLSMVPYLLIFGDGAMMAMQYANIPLMLLAYLGIALITKKYFGEKVAYATYLALLMFLPAWTLTTFVYGTWPAMCTAVWAMYLGIRYEEEARLRYAVGAGLLLAVSIMCKSNSAIFLIAVEIMIALSIVRDRNYRKFLGVAIILGLCLLQMKAVPWYVHTVTGEDTNAGIPMIAWLAMGLQESSIAPGWYNEFPVNLYRHVSMDQDVIKMEVMQSFRDSFALFAQNPEYMVRFFARKLASMWADPAFQCFTGINTKDHGEFSYAVKDAIYNGGTVNTVLYLLLDVLQSIQYFGVILFLLCTRKKFKLEKAHLTVAFLGGFLFHLIGEAKSHYVINYALLLIPFAVQGYVLATGRLLTVWNETGETVGARLKLQLQKSENAFLKQADHVQNETGNGNRTHFNVGRMQELLRILIRCNAGRIALVMSGLVVIFTLWNGSILTNTIKLGGEESDYVWYCQTQTQWQDEGYAKY